MVMVMLVLVPRPRWIRTTTNTPPENCCTGVQEAWDKRAAFQPAMTCYQLLTLPAATVHAAVPANTFAIYGNGEDKELTELVPGILNQLGPDSLASLRKLAESYQSMQKSEEGKEADDDDIPELVAGETFEGESKVE